MAAFEHVLVLLSFVYALALTHLLSRVAALYVARDRVQFSPLLALMITNAVLTVFFSWLALWPFRSATNWDLFSIIVQFLYALEVFLFCAVAAPDVQPEGPIVLDAYYWREYRSFYGMFLLSILTAMAGNFTFLKTASPSAFWTWQLASLPVFIPVVLALTVRARWAQWAAGLILLAITLGLSVILEETLT